jgi:hypothetical protein
MKSVASIFLVLFSSYSIGQSCDTIADQILNCIDDQGWKQGYWETREVDERITCILLSVDTPENERQRTYFDASVMVSSGSYVNNLKHGYWKTYFNNGLLESEGYYSNGLKQGHWIVRDELGQEEITGTYSDDLKVGVWRFLFEYRDTSFVEKEIRYKIVDGQSVEVARTIYAFEGDTIVKSFEGAIGKGFKWIRTYPFTYYEISADNLTITGETIRDGTTISLLCKDGGCQFVLPNGFAVVQFSFNELLDYEKELDKLELGMYDRKIKLSTTR